MAFVVARPRGRYEIREAVHTADGPRARSLANFAVLTDDFLTRAAARATRGFDRAAVLASARRLGAPVELSRARRPAVATVGDAVTTTGDPRYRRFAATSRRLARALEHAAPADRAEPGRALIDLLAFADEVGRSQPARPRQPLTFPSLARLVGLRQAQPRRRTPQTSTR